MDNKYQELVAKLAYAFLNDNYDYIWLKSMLVKAINNRVKNGTLITGSSHALNGIYEGMWDKAINLSMHSQDIYYDFICVKNVIEKNINFNKCFVFLGYYIAFQDLSLGTIMREQRVAPIYYPIFGDAHNWDYPTKYDLWKGFSDIPYDMMELCESLAVELMIMQDTYYAGNKKRKPFFDFGNRLWSELSETEKDFFAMKRTESHNKFGKHINCYEENKEIVKDLIHLLNLNNVMPCFVVSPFTKNYNKYVDVAMKEALYEMLNSCEEEVHFIDFNESELFNDNDFVDTDHLSEEGAIKLSTILTEVFGK